MQQHITWAPVLIFSLMLVGLALFEHFRTRPRKKSRRSNFRRLQSPFARSRRRNAPATARAAFARPPHVEARRRFTR